MNPLLLVLLIALASNLDTIGVGIAYGVRGIRVTLPANIIVAVIGLLATYLTVWAGTFISRFLHPQVAHAIAAVMFIGLGIWILLTQWGHRKDPQDQAKPTKPSFLDMLRKPEQADRDHSGTISLQESVTLGLALAINNLTNGLTAGLWRLPVLATALASGGLSLLTLWAGAWLASRYAARWLGDKATIAAGVLLICIGLLQLR